MNDVYHINIVFSVFALNQGESVTFRATTHSVLVTLNQCVEIISQREEYFRKKMDTEVERRRQSEDMCK